jgi:hypothetical protein
MDLRTRIEELQRQWNENGAVDPELARSVFGDPAETVSSSMEQPISCDMSKWNQEPVNKV